MTQGNGLAFLYERSGSTWTQVRKLEAYDGANGDQFSRDMDISGNIALVGAPKDDHATQDGPNSGSIYVYIKEGSFWSDGHSASCGFKDAVSDGQKYIFASNTAGGSFVE